MDVDFVLVGGGIGGAVLAERLGRGGKRVIVLEKATAPPAFVRPEVLWPRTAAVLFSLAPRADWEAESMLAMRGVELQEGRRTIPAIDVQLLREVGIQPFFTSPNALRERLLRLPSFELRRGVEVVSVLEDGGRIAGVRARTLATGAEEEIAARATIGDDGVHSVVRRAARIELETKVFPVDFLTIPIDWPAALPPATGHIWLNIEGARSSGILGFAAAPFADGQGAGLVLARPRDFDRCADPHGAWRDFTAADPVIDALLAGRRFPEDFFRIKRPWGHAARYGADGAFIMGDAAHPVSPAGGQGANMSVADGCALAEILLGGEPDALGAYERRRRRANERSIGITRTVARLFDLPDRLAPGRLFPRIVFWAAQHPWLVRRGLRRAARSFQEP